ncbi:MAG TPA: hypothetical protein VN829_07525, partial [Dongiaceae bacterium]|nr:hypothetical protein [Dongiaceae bacterium]
MSNPKTSLRADLWWVLAALTLALNPGNLSAASTGDTNLAPLSTAFTYQGLLEAGGGPASGIYDLRFTLYDAPTNGATVAGPLTNSAVAISNGLFTVALDFGAVFDGTVQWLEIDVRSAGAGRFTSLAPLQALTAVPYAVAANSAANLAGTLPATQLSGTIPLGLLPGAILTNGQNGVSLAGAFAGNAAGLTNLDAGALVSGTVPLARLPNQDFAVRNYAPVITQGENYFAAWMHVAATGSITNTNGLLRGMILELDSSGPPSEIMTPLDLQLNYGGQGSTDPSVASSAYGARSIVSMSGPYIHAIAYKGVVNGSGQEQRDIVFYGDQPQAASAHGNAVLHVGGVGGTISFSGSSSDLASMWSSIQSPSSGTLTFNGGEDSATLASLSLADATLGNGEISGRIGRSTIFAFDTAAAVFGVPLAANEVLDANGGLYLPAG